jgi:toxin ParE1/3/4
VAKVVKRPRALADLAEIWAHIGEGSPDNADVFAARINDTLRALADYPRMGRARTELGEHLRSFVVGRYVILYLPLANGIEVVRVLHGARDIEAIFEEE